VTVGLGAFRPCFPINKVSPGPELEVLSFDLFLFFFRSFPFFGIALGGAALQRTHGSRLASRGGVLVYETRDPVLLVSGRVGHAPRAKTRQNS
jgi:hypothetical protein